MLSSLNSSGLSVQWAHIDAIDHWVCGVAATVKPFRLHMACSYRKTHEDWKPGGQYREQYHEKVKRYFNNWLGLHHDCRIVTGSVFRIWREDTGQTPAEQNGMPSTGGFDAA
jgi:hypothetical protein